MGMNERITDALKKVSIPTAIRLAIDLLFLFVFVGFTTEIAPVITGDVLLEDSAILTRSQMSGWIVWMNTAVLFYMTHRVLLVCERGCRKKKKENGKEN